MDIELIFVQMCVRLTSFKIYVTSVEKHRRCDIKGQRENRSVIHARLALGDPTLLYVVHYYGVDICKLKRKKSSIWLIML